MLGMHYILTYITCNRIWGASVGVKLMKYYDFHYLFGHILSVVIKRVFPNDQDYFSIFKVFIFTHLILSCGICFIPKSKE
jgi:hypothetical protein